MPAFKLIKSGHIIEIYEYERTPAIDRGEESLKKGGRKVEGGRVDRKQEYKNLVNQRGRQKLRRLIQANFDNTALLLTVTFAENMQDIAAANYEFKKFIQKLKRKHAAFKHVTVIEFQKRGAIHYHTMCNLPHEFSAEDSPGEGKEKSAGLQRYQGELGQIWGHGFVFVKPISHVDNTGAYLIKYMQKDMHDARLDGKKRYFFSRDLIQPEELQGAELLLWKNTLEGNAPVYTSDYEHEHTGKVRYSEFNLKRLDAVEWGLLNGVNDVETTLHGENPSQK